MIGKIKLLFSFGLITISMVTYIAIMGLSANRASAVSIHDFSQDLIDNWHYVATTLNIPLENTKPGMLAPVVPERFSALDLSIYGYELVTPEYKEYYRSLELPQMLDRLHISTNGKGILQYNVGGVYSIALQDEDGRTGAVFYRDVPSQLIDEMSQLYDGVSMKGDRDGSGSVRYDRLENGHYVMGIFLPYSGPTG